MKNQNIVHKNTFKAFVSGAGSILSLFPMSSLSLPSKGNTDKKNLEEDLNNIGNDFSQSIKRLDRGNK